MRGAVDKGDTVWKCVQCGTFRYPLSQSFSCSACGEWQVMTHLERPPPDLYDYDSFSLSQIGVETGDA